MKGVILLAAGIGVGVPLGWTGPVYVATWPVTGLPVSEGKP
jgi:hypothetical protein